MDKLMLMLPKKYQMEEIRNNYVITAETKKVWTVELDLLAQLINVCERYHLRWFAYGGTLLGAVRHKGFIPWDKDIDIMMPRSDYEQLLKIGTTAFPKPYFFQTIYTEQSPYFRAFARVRNSNTTGINFIDIKSHANGGIFIDIFPLDYVPDNLSSRMKVGKLINRIFGFKYVLCPSPNVHIKHKNLKTFIVLCSLGMINSRSLYKILHFFCTLTSKSQTVAHLTLGYKEKLVWRKDAWDNSVWMDFEMIKVRVPIGYDHILTQQYGNYMALPPMEKRHANEDCIFDSEMPYTQYLSMLNTPKTLL